MSEPRRFSIPIQSFALTLAALIVLTSSFDIFLVLQAGGTYRFCQLLTPLLLALALLKAKRTRVLPVVVGFSLYTWCLVQIVFVPVAYFWQKSLGYCFWLLLNLALLWSFVQLFATDLRTLAKLLRFYAWSFGAVALFGILQFALPLIGIIPPLITQWWIPGAIARANGFSYEPSYFATYLLIGFVFVAALRREHSHLLSSRELTILYLLTATGIVVSSSRMGMVLLFIDVLLAQLRIWRTSWRGILIGRLSRAKLSALAWSAVAIAVLCVVPLGIIQYLQARPAVAFVVLSGTGLSNTPGHSVVQRGDAFEDTLQVFFDHPFIGQSLGGVSSAIADLHGQRISSFEESKQFEGMNVFAEALAASGIIGIVPFLIFLVTTVAKPLKLAKAVEPAYAVILHALVRSLVFAWLTLQFNQNILRPYLWAHLAMLMAVYAAAVRTVRSPFLEGSVLTRLLRLRVPGIHSPGTSRA